MEPQEDSRQRRRGPISHGIDFLNTGRTIWQGAKLVRTAGVFAGALNPATIAIAVGAIIVLLVFFIVLDTGTGIAEGVPGDGTEPTTTITPPGGGGSPIAISGTDEACVSPYLGNKDCSVGNLQKYFGGDRNKAIIASLICQSESGSYPLALNDTCSTNDYSIGLFQINAVAHCAGAYSSQSCHNLLSSAKRSICLATWRDPDQNIQQALRISNNGTSWSAWGTWLNAGKTRFGIKDLLTQCRISI